VPFEAAFEAADHRVGVAALSASAAITVVSVRTIVRAASWVTPRRPAEFDEQVDIVAVARIVLGVDQIEIDARPDASGRSGEPDVDDVRPPDQDRLGDSFLDDDLRCAQHALVLAIGVDDALARASFAAEKIGFMTGRS
jgi:hypothetical protein